MHAIVQLKKKHADVKSKEYNNFGKDIKILNLNKDSKFKIGDIAKI